MKEKENSKVSSWNFANPFQIYYDDLVLDGLQSLRNYNFEAARRSFSDAERNAVDNRIPQILRFLAIGLHLWDLFDHQKAERYLSDVLKYVNQYQKLLPLRPILEKWIQFLKRISQSNTVVEEQIIDIFFNGSRMYEREQYDNAAMRYYRASEMINQFILKKEYNLDTQHADYTSLNSVSLNDQCNREKKEKSQVLLEKFNEIWYRIFEKRGEKQNFKPNTLLHLKIGLINGLILRNILGDPVLKFDFLFKIYDAVDIRNNSILAHGVKPIKDADCNKLKSICESMITPFLERKKTVKELIFNQNQLKDIFHIIRMDL